MYTHWKQLNIPLFHFLSALVLNRLHRDYYPPPPLSYLYVQQLI